MMTNEYWCFCQSYIVLLYFQHYGSVMYGWARTSFIAYCIYSLAGRIQVYWTVRTRGGNETGEHQVFEFYDIKRQASEKNMLPDHKWRGEVFLKVVRLLSCIRWTRSSINTHMKDVKWQALRRFICLRPHASQCSKYHWKRTLHTRWWYVPTWKLLQRWSISVVKDLNSAPLPSFATKTSSWFESIQD